MQKFRGKMSDRQHATQQCHKHNIYDYQRIVKKKWIAGLVMGLHTMFDLCVHPSPVRLIISFYSPTRVFSTLFCWPHSKQKTVGGLEVGPLF